MPTSEVKGKEVRKEAQDAKELFKLLKEMSDLLETNLDNETLKCCLRLIERGINPETLSEIVLELQKEVRHQEVKKRFSQGSGDGPTI